MLIASACDEKFVPHFATMLHSAWHHNREARFLLLDCGLAGETREVLKRFAADLGTRLDIKKVDLTRFEHAATGLDWPVIVFARLLLPDMLSCRKVLYLDSDCVVTADLTRFWETDLGSSFVAGVSDQNAIDFESGLEPKIPLPPSYVNCGVMLMNLDAWREHDISSQVVTYVETYRPKFGEQTGINAVTGDRKLMLPDRWNFMVHVWSMRSPADFDPSIVHCTGHRKPWLHANACFAPVYLAHRNATPFKLASPTAIYPGRLKVFLNLLVFRPKYRKLRKAKQYYDMTFSPRYLAANRIDIR